MNLLNKYSYVNMTYNKHSSLFLVWADDSCAVNEMLVGKRTKLAYSAGVDTGQQDSERI